MIKKTWFSVLSLNNPKLDKTRVNNISTQEQFILQLSFYPRLASTNFQTTQPFQKWLTWLEPAIQLKTSTWSAVNFKRYM